MNLIMKSWTKLWEQKLTSMFNYWRKSRYLTLEESSVRKDLVLLQKCKKGRPFCRQRKRRIWTTQKPFRAWKFALTLMSFLMSSSTLRIKAILKATRLCSVPGANISKPCLASSMGSERLQTNSFKSRVRILSRWLKCTVSQKSFLTALFNIFTQTISTSASKALSSSCS